MGLLDSVIGAIGGAAGNGAAGTGPAGMGTAGAGGPAGGGRAALISLVIGLLMNRAQSGGGGGLGGLGGLLPGAGGGATDGLGGLGGLISRFQQGGLGDVVGSWIGTGHNLPVSPDQVHQVLGGDLISQIAQQLGVSHGEAAGQVSEVLPEVVDKLTPNGQLPADGGFGDIGEILGRFGHR